MSSTTLSENDLKLARIIKNCRDNPLKFFKGVLKVDLDKQQARLVHYACKPGSRVMVKSARGTGKTFIITGLTLYFLLCFDDVNIRILSPSELQLKTVFMREISKHLANMDQEIASYYLVGSMDIKHKFKKLNIAQCATASTKSTENVSGVHSNKQVYLLDEASGITDDIYSTILGSLATAIAAKGDHVIGVSNPNRGVGLFYSDLFRKLPKNWQLFTFTAEKCRMIPQSFIDDMAETYGEDSDEYRVSVLGEFPRADGSVFIPESIVEEAEERMALHSEYCREKIILGADIARSLSGDKTVFVVRQGNKVKDIISFKTDDTMETVAKLLDTVRAHNVDVVYGDATGVGGPVFDRIREVFRASGISTPVVDVVVANQSNDPIQYFNIRAQLWGEMRVWLTTADIPKHYELKKELSSMTWGYSGRMQIQLTAKKQLKSKGIDSPDHADALALTMTDRAVTVRRTIVVPRKVRQTNYLWI